VSVSEPEAGAKPPRPLVERAIERSVFVMLGVLYACAVVTIALFDIGLYRRGYRGSSLAYLLIFAFLGLWWPIHASFMAVARKGRASAEALPPSTAKTAAAMAVPFAAVATGALYWTLCAAWPFVSAVIFPGEGPR
jgi:hypothetical protein